MTAHGIRSRTVTVSVVSWLTDPDGEWSSEDDAGRRPRHGHREQGYPEPGYPEPGYPQPGYPEQGGSAAAYAGRSAAGSAPPGSYPEQGGYPEPEPAGYPFGQEPSGYHDFADYGEEEPPRSRFRLIALIVAAWFVVSVVVLGLLLVTHGPKAKTPTAQGSSGSSAAPSPSTSSSPDATLPAGWVKRATDDQTNCAVHAYGQVATFFASSPCSSVHRVLATVTAAGRPAVIASYTVIFTSADTAAKYNALVASDGTGNINDLLREGVTYPGAPPRLPNAAFSSKQQGQRVLVAEAGYTTGTSNPTDPVLLQLTQQSIAAG